MAKGGCVFDVTEFLGCGGGLVRISCDLAVRKMVVRWGLLLELECGFKWGLGRMGGV